MKFIQRTIQMMQNNDFCAFILTHGRPDRVYTYQSLKKHGFTGKIFIVVDDEDKTIAEYQTNFGKENVIVFKKSEIAKTFDEADNFNDRRAIIYARNVCFQLAKDLGYKYFIQLDDDYTAFRYTFDNNQKYITQSILIKQLDKVLDAMVDFYKSTNILTVAMSQGGDFIGGPGSNVAKLYMEGKPSRKAMNSFICSTERPFQFFGRINEDVNTYTNLAFRGGLFLTFARIRLEQKQTQSNAGGMTELYLDSGTYVKSFYTVMYQPSSVKIKLMGAVNKRLHHAVKWENTVPMILDEKYKKLQTITKN